MLNGFLSAFKNLTPMNWETVKPALNFLWQGLLAIFVTIGLIVLAVKLTSFGIEKAQKFTKERQNRIDAAKAEVLKNAEQSDTKTE